MRYERLCRDQQENWAPRVMLFKVTQSFKVTETGRILMASYQESIVIMGLSSTFSRQTAILVETKLFTFLVYNALVWGGTLKFYNAGWYATRRIRALSEGGTFDDVHFDTIMSTHWTHTETDGQTERWTEMSLCLASY